MWVVEEVTEAVQELSTQHCSLLDSSPTYSTTTQRCRLSLSVDYLRLIPYYLTRMPTPETNMVQMKEQVKAPEKIQLSDEEIASESLQNTGNQDAHRNG